MNKWNFLKRTENSTSDSQTNFTDIKDDSYNISEIEEEEVVDCSKLYVINVTSINKGKEKCDESLVKNNTDEPSTSKVHDRDRVIVEDSLTDSDDDNEVDSSDIIISRVVVEQVYEETDKFNKVMKETCPHYLESNFVVYPNFKCIDDVVFPNQVFVIFTLFHKLTKHAFIFIMINNVLHKHNSMSRITCLLVVRSRRPNFVSSIIIISILHNQ